MFLLLFIYYYYYYYLRLSYWKANPRFVICWWKLFGTLVIVPEVLHLALLPACLFSILLSFFLIIVLLLSLFLHLLCVRCFNLPFLVSSAAAAVAAVFGILFHCINDMSYVQGQLINDLEFSSFFNHHKPNLHTLSVESCGVNPIHSCSVFSFAR